MYYREVEIKAPTDLGPSGTDVTDIKIRDPISSIEIIWDTTVNTAAAMTGPHVECLSLIEIVDGSDVLFHLSGEEAQALAAYTMGRLPYNEITVVAGEHMRSVIPIYFGRKLFDKELALDPTKFRNPQIKITWDEDVANAGVTANLLTIRAWAFDERSITPRGFLMSKQHKEYTPVANGYEYTTMPTDYPYRCILFRSKSDNLEPGEVLNQFRLSEDHDKRVPIDMTGEEIIQKIVSTLGEMEESFKLSGTPADQTIEGSLTAKVRGLLNLDYDAVAAADDAEEVAIANNIYTVSGVVGFIPAWLSVKGYCPHSCLFIPCGDLMDIDDWWDVTKLGDLRLTTQGAATVGTNPVAQICIQQYRKY